MYNQAVDAAPNDPAPLSNLSAVYFEQGDYASVVTASDRALELLDDDAKRQKLLLRKGKSHVYLRNYDLARHDAESLSKSNDKSKLLASISSHLDSQKVAGSNNDVHTKIITHHPRFKPQM